MNTPTMREKIAVYESILHDLHCAACVSMSKERTGKLLDAISSWSYAHRQGNGELSDKEQQGIIDKAFWRMKEV